MRRLAAMGVTLVTIGLSGPAQALELGSRSFHPGGKIPAEYAMEAVSGGRNRSLEFHWTEVPPKARSLVLSLIDLNPIAHGWVHWLVIDIPPHVREFPAGASGHLPPGARELRNSFSRLGYGGPQPPPGSGPHPYQATLYALSIPDLAVGPQATWAQVRAAMTGHVLAHASVTGTFEQ